MMIKGSLLCSIPIVKRFRAKFSVRNRAENWWFWRGKILTPTLRPLGNQTPPKHVIWRKNCVGSS